MQGESEGQGKVIHCLPFANAKRFIGSKLFRNVSLLGLLDHNYTCTKATSKPGIMTQTFNTWEKEAEGFFILG